MAADHLTRFARVDFRNDERVFGIKDEDRLLHLYVIGKTGTGKSTLLENMALQDLERGKALHRSIRMAILSRALRRVFLNGDGPTSSIWTLLIRANRSATIRFAMSGRIVSHSPLPA